MDRVIDLTTGKVKFTVSDSGPLILDNADFTYLASVEAGAGTRSVSVMNCSTGRKNEISSDSGK